MRFLRPRTRTLGTSTSGSGGLLRLALDAVDDFDFSVIAPADVLVLAAAISSPDVVSRDMGRARRVNVEGTTELVAHAIARGARVIFLSSDTVYGERPEAFDERAGCVPAGDYARMKREVEQACANRDAFKAVRLSYVFSEYDRFTRYLVGCAADGVEAEIFDPFSRAVIALDDVVDGILALALRWREFSQPILNFGGPDVVPRVEFARLLQQIAVPTLRFRVVEMSAAFSANRPKNIHMRSPALSTLLGRPASSLGDAIRKQFASRS